MIKYVSGHTKSFNQLALDFYHILNPRSEDNFKRGALAYRLSKLIESTTEPYKSFYSIFLENDCSFLKAIIIGEPSELETLMSEVEFIRTALQLPDMSVEKEGQKTLTAFGREIYSVFNYDSFRSHTKCDWLLEALDIPICAYCNRKDTISINTKDNTKHLFSIDHYYCKVMHPYLALSFYNLIPSCYTCNSTYKGTKNFSIETHTHPYMDSFHSYFKFNFSPPTSYLKDLNFSIILEKRIHIDDINLTRGGKLIDDLGLEEVYQHNLYKREVKRIFDIISTYPQSQVDEIINIKIAGKTIVKNFTDFKHEEMNLVLNDDDIRHTLFGKLKQDMANYQ
jgi:hypothetical protein